MREDSLRVAAWVWTAAFLVELALDVAILYLSGNWSRTWILTPFCLLIAAGFWVAVLVVKKKKPTEYQPTQNKMEPPI